MRLYSGLDLSRKRLDWCCCRVDGTVVDAGAVPPDLDGFARLVHRLGDAEVVAVVETMNGARFVHDQLELAGWDVRIAGLSGRGRSPRWRVRATGSMRRCWPSSPAATSYPRCGCPAPASAVSASGPASVSTWSSTAGCSRTGSTRRWSRTGSAGRPGTCSAPSGCVVLERLPLPEPWHGTLCASLLLIESLDEQAAAIERELRALGVDHPYVPLLKTAPGIAWILAYTIASEIGDINRFPTARKLIGYTGLCPRVYQSGETDRRGPLARNGPNYLRRAL